LKRSLLNHMINSINIPCARGLCRHWRFPAISAVVFEMHSRQSAKSSARGPDG
jgi:hypothetical protein